jgi:hypothetical protein
VELRDLGEAEATRSITDDGLAIQVEGTAADMLAFQSRPPHASANPLDNEATLEFGDGSDDDENGATQWTAAVDALANRDELYAEAMELIQGFQQVTYRARHAIEGGNHYDVEAVARSIRHQAIESRAAGAHSGDPVIDIFVHDFEPALLGQLTQVNQLSFRMLV